MFKHIYHFICPALILAVLSGCLSTKEDPIASRPSEEQALADTEPAADTTDTPETTSAVVLEDTPEEDEYSRSITALGAGTTITKDVFQEDKKQILEIIEKLSVAMDKQDYSTWFKYVDPDSIKYWRNPRNLKKASDRLPVKGISLGGVQDYFRYVFIPARAGKNVDEIRYISETAVKAVQVQDNTDIIYYYFGKVNGRWMVQLPTL